MTEARRQQLRNRWDWVNARLAVLHSQGQTDSPEAEQLNGELDGIEGELGEVVLAESRAERKRWGLGRNGKLGA